MIRIYYPLPNSIEVRANDVVVKPKLQVNDEVMDLTNHIGCGANNFFFDEGIIEFVVTGFNCQVKLRITSFIQLTTRIETTVQEFYAEDFINNICAFLGIDPGRMKIVSVREGSVIV